MRHPQMREDLSEIVALRRCIQRRNSQVALILALVLISLSACLMPQTSRAHVGNQTHMQPGHSEHQIGRFFERNSEHIHEPLLSVRSLTSRTLRGGGLTGKPVTDSLRGDSLIGRERTGRVLAYRGGAAGVANSSSADARGRGGSYERRRGKREDPNAARPRQSSSDNPVLSSFVRNEEEMQKIAARVSSSLTEAMKDFEPQLKQIEEEAAAVQKRISMLGPNSEDEEGKGLFTKVWPRPRACGSILKLERSKIETAISRIRTELSPLDILRQMYQIGLRVDTRTLEMALEYAEDHHDERLKTKLLFLCLLQACVVFSAGELKLKDLLKKRTYNASEIHEFRKEFLGEDSEKEEVSDTEYGVEIYEGAEKLGLRKGIVTYSALLAACVRTSNWAYAMQIFRNIQQEGLKMNAHMYHAAVLAAKGLGEWQRSLSLLAEMENKGIGWNEETHEIMGAVGELVLKKTDFESVMIRVDGVKFVFDSAVPPPHSYVQSVSENVSVPQTSAATPLKVRDYEEALRRGEDPLEVTARKNREVLESNPIFWFPPNITELEVIEEAD